MDMRKIGIKWGIAKILPIAYTISKLQMRCYAVEELLSIDEMEEQLLTIQMIQSVDVVYFVSI